MKESRYRGSIVLPDADHTMKRLHYDCGWKSQSIFKCNVCQTRLSMNIGKNDGYDLAKPRIIAHIIKEHPMHCYGCSNCPALFTTKGDFSMHKCKPV
jgi:hypothetical protein